MKIESNLESRFLKTRTLITRVGIIYRIPLQGKRACVGGKASVVRTFSIAAMCVCVYTHVRRPLTSFEHPSIRLNSLRAVETPAIYRLTNTFNETPLPRTSFSKKITYTSVKETESFPSPFFFIHSLSNFGSRKVGSKKKRKKYRPDSKLSKLEKYRGKFCRVLESTEGD